MTVKYTIVWTLLPDPAVPPSADGTLHLTLVLSPRLTTTDGSPPGTAVHPLSSYPLIAALPTLSYQVFVVYHQAGGHQQKAAVFNDGALDTDLWNHLFPSTTPVNSFHFNEALAPAPIRSYPAHLVERSLSEQYSRLFGAEGGDGAEHVRAVVPWRLSTTEATERWQAVDHLVDTIAPPDDPDSVRALSDLLRRHGSLPDVLDVDPHGWARLAAFHSPPGPAGQVQEPVAEAPERPGNDFHALVAALTDHPDLMARTGLVRRLAVPPPSPLTDGPLTLQAFVTHGAQIEDFRPCTACVAASGRLFLARRDGNAALFLPLNDTTTYTATDVDVDAGGLALQSYAHLLRRRPRDEPPPAVRPPALRSDGIAVMEANRQIAFGQALRTAKNANDDLKQGLPGDATTLASDTLQTGFRLDVFDEGSNRWYPLCRRTGTYTVRGLAHTIPIDDEGIVTDVVGQNVDADGDGNTLSLHQNVFRWNGWSPVVAPDGRTLDLNGNTVDPGASHDSTLPYSVQLGVPDNTLPSLRYGRRYRFRARLVDLAGRATPFTQQPVSGEPATPTLRYCRYEPIPAPILVPRKRMTEGESPTLLIVRTDNANPSAPTLGPPSERHLLPPKAAVQLLERHGVLDEAAKHRLDPQVYALLKQLDGGVVPRTTTDDGAGGTPYMDVDRMQPLWAPDPYSRGIALDGWPMAALRMEWPHGTAWHEQFPVRLTVRPGAAGTAPQVTTDAAARLIQVTVAPGASFPVRLSSALSTGDEENLGLWRWFINNGHTPAEITAARADALAGRLSQLTPATELQILHAVRCPLQPPTFSQVAVLRDPGATSYVLDDPALQVHDLTTQSVHIEAAWDEFDDTAPSGPITSPARTVLRQDERDTRPAPPPGAPTLAAEHFRSRHDLGDNRHHRLRYTPVGTSRFVKYFAQRRTVHLAGTTPVTLAGAFVPGTVVVRAAVPPTAASGTPGEPGTTYLLDRDVRVDTDHGTVTRMPGGAIADNAAVDVSFVVPPVTSASAATSLDVPATVQPPAPAVESVVPAFKWQLDQSGGTLVSTRHGALRVYLKRPWYASGEDEQLAVMVMGQNATPDGHSAEWATMWGRDPVRGAGSAETIGYPRPSDLKADAMVQTGPGQAMAYDVKFDDIRKLWYADIRFTADSVYEPFVRLRVARLQQHALLTPTDLRLSSVVDAGFAKIPAFRRTSMSRTGNSVTVTVVGPVPPPGAAVPAGDVSSEVTAVVQVRSATVAAGGDALAWLTLDTSPPMTLNNDAVGVIGRWKGTLQLPPDAVAAHRPMRLLVQEFERYQGPADNQISRRPMYLDTLPIA
ncbi:hypothetical protein [Streptomyces diastatochromogenes]|nr:hypothetical protein [Streptomyces diastatochromogenes]MCZ0990405.1 hypothetical protein [Streptomyces diastatochromogenes]